MIKVMRGILVEYAVSIPPLVLSFEFNPETLSRSRTITMSDNTARMKYSRGSARLLMNPFRRPTETPKTGS